MPKKDTPDVVRLRFRRTTTLAGAVRQANSVDSLEATDEVWDAVNRGDADMEPAPGVDGQPFPPERLTQAPAPTPPMFATPAVPGTVSTAGPAGAGAGQDYDAMTVEDLHKLAADRNIEGRSELKHKDQLVKAHQKFDRAQRK
jgi:hypothetical protein